MIIPIRNWKREIQVYGITTDDITWTFITWSDFAMQDVGTVCGAWRLFSISRLYIFTHHRNDPSKINYLYDVFQAIITNVKLITSI